MPHPAVLAWFGARSTQGLALLAVAATTLFLLLLAAAAEGAAMV